MSILRGAVNLTGGQINSTSIGTGTVASAAAAAVFTTLQSNSFQVNNGITTPLANSSPGVAISGNMPLTVGSTYWVSTTTTPSMTFVTSGAGIMQFQSKYVQLDLGSGTVGGVGQQTAGASFVTKNAGMFTVYDAGVQTKSGSPTSQGSGITLYTENVLSCSANGSNSAMDFYVDNGAQLYLGLLGGNTSGNTTSAVHIADDVATPVYIGGAGAAVAICNSTNAGVASITMGNATSTMTVGASSTFLGTLTQGVNTSSTAAFTVWGPATFNNGITSTNTSATNTFANLSLTGAVTTSSLTVSNTGSSASFAGNVTVAGNLYVNGTYTPVSTATLEVSDNMVIANATPSAPGVASGFLVARYKSDVANDTGANIAFTGTSVGATTALTPSATVQLSALASTVLNAYVGYFIQVGTDVHMISGYTTGRVATIAASIEGVADAGFSQIWASGSTINIFSRPYTGMIWDETNKLMRSASMVRNTTTQSLSEVQDAGFSCNAFQVTGTSSTSINAVISTIGAATFTAMTCSGQSYLIGQINMGTGGNQANVSPSGSASFSAIQTTGTLVVSGACTTGSFHTTGNATVDASIVVTGLAHFGSSGQATISLTGSGSFPAISLSGSMSVLGVSNFGSTGQATIGATGAGSFPSMSVTGASNFGSSGQATITATGWGEFPTIVAGGLTATANVFQFTGISGATFGSAASIPSSGYSTFSGLYCNGGVTGTSLLITTGAATFGTIGQNATINANGTATFQATAVASLGVTGTMNAVGPSYFGLITTASTCATISAVGGAIFQSLVIGTTSALLSATISTSGAATFQATSVASLGVGTNSSITGAGLATFLTTSSTTLNVSGGSFFGSGVGSSATISSGGIATFQATTVSSLQCNGTITSTGVATFAGIQLNATTIQSSAAATFGSLSTGVATLTSLSASGSISVASTSIFGTTTCATISSAGVGTFQAVSSLGTITSTGLATFAGIQLNGTTIQSSSGATFGSVQCNGTITSTGVATFAGIQLNATTIQSSAAALFGSLALGSGTLSTSGLITVGSLLAGTAAGLISTGTPAVAFSGGTFFESDEILSPVTGATAMATSATVNNSYIFSAAGTGIMSGILTSPTLTGSRSSIKKTVAICQLAGSASVILAVAAGVYLYDASGAAHLGTGTLSGATLEFDDVGSSVNLLWASNGTASPAWFLLGGSGVIINQ